MLGSGVKICMYVSKLRDKKEGEVGGREGAQALPSLASKSDLACKDPDHSGGTPGTTPTDLLPYYWGQRGSD